MDMISLVENELGKKAEIKFLANATWRRKRVICQY